MWPSCVATGDCTAGFCSLAYLRPHSWQCGCWICFSSPLGPLFRRWSKTKVDSDRSKGKWRPGQSKRTTFRPGLRNGLQLDRAKRNGSHSNQGIGKRTGPRERISTNISLWHQYQLPSSGKMLLTAAMASLLILRKPKEWSQFPYRCNPLYRLHSF